MSLKAIEHGVHIHVVTLESEGGLLGWLPLVIPPMPPCFYALLAVLPLLRHVPLGPSLPTARQLVTHTVLVMLKHGHLPSFALFVKNPAPLTQNQGHLHGGVVVLLVQKGECEGLQDAHGSR